MHFLSFVCVFSVITSVALAALLQIRADPNFKEGCRSYTTGIMRKGETKYLDNCLRAECGNDGSIEVASCGLAVVSGDCSGIPKSEEVKDKDYPDCCIPICKP